MKKRNYLLALSLLSVGVLAACNPVVTSSTSSSDTGTNGGETSTSEPSTTLPTPEQTEFNITLNAGLGSKITVTTEKGENGYKAGSTVEFIVEVTGEEYEVSEVKINDRVLDLTENYAFVMPNHDITISTTTKVLGGNDVLNPTKFTTETFEALPTTVKALDEFLATTKENNGKYLKEASFKQTTTDQSSYNDLYDVNIKAGNNDTLLVDGFYYTTSTDFRKTYHEERGIKDGYYYSLIKKSTVGTGTEDIDVLKLSAEETIDSSYEIKEADANLNVKFFDAFAVLSKTYFNASYGYNWANASVTKELSQDELYATYTIVESQPASYSNGHVSNVSIVLDGDGFVSQISLVKNEYDSDSYVEGVLQEGAVAVLTETFTYNATRGYKPTINSDVDLNDYVMHDYDLYTKTYIDGKSYYATNGGETYVGASLSFKFINKDNNLTQIKPRLIGCEEGEEGFIENDFGITVKKAGTFHLVFDNGLGETKSFEFTAVLPPASGINVSVDKSEIIVGGTATITAQVKPEGAVQEFVVTKGVDSVDYDIVDNKDGTFTVTAKQAGTIKINIACKENEEFSKDVTITVFEKPTYEEVYETITTMTLLGTSGDDTFKLNFNSDGTGVFQNEYEDWYETTISYTNFTYTLDPETLEFVITPADGGDGSNVLTSIQAVSATKFNVTYECYSSPKNLSMEAVERVELGK